MEFVHNAVTMDLILVARKEVTLYHQATEQPLSSDCETLRFILSPSQIGLIMTSSDPLAGLKSKYNNIK